MGLLNLEEQLAFYGRYHSNKINIIIHIVCVPLILWSALVWAANTGPLLPYGEDSLWRLTPFVPNLSFFTILFYIAYYILLEPFAGVLYTPFLLFAVHNATNFASAYPNHNTLATIVHVFSWVAQLISHAFAEGKSPAVKDNVAQALLLAPLFVFLEVLFTFNYRKSLQKKIKLMILEHESSVEEKKRLMKEEKERLMKEEKESEKELKKEK